MSNRVKLIDQKLKSSLIRKRFLNINHIQVDNEEKLAELGKIFRNSQYETFRMIYTKDNSVVGEEIISTRILGNSSIFTSDEQGYIRVERRINKIRNTMNKINADGYYMIHTYPSENLILSKKNLDTTNYFFNNLNGFKGHLILNSTAYSWIGIHHGKPYIITNKKLKKTNIFLQHRISRNGIYHISIRKRKTLISLINIIINKTDLFSTIILSSVENVPQMIFDIPNKTINCKSSKTISYLQNIIDTNKDKKMFLSTNNGNTFKNSLGLTFFNNSVWYEDINGKLFLYPTPKYIN